MIDPTQPIGKVRLRVGDWSDLTILPDTVVQSALDDSGGSIPRATKLCAQYILATLTAKTHKKLTVVEMWGAEQFANYVQFIETVILRADFNGLAPVPYIGADQEPHPIAEFITDWKAGYLPGATVLPPGYNFPGQTQPQYIAPIIINDNPS